MTSGFADSGRWGRVSRPDVQNDAATAGWADPADAAAGFFSDVVMSCLLVEFNSTKRTTYSIV